ncbi:MAG: tetratricopeptide repeat protein [Alphaproteobacteria bacterium]|nr:tetratricopeptide repeat protein [Alphaproteobacteria bacterium]
MRNVAAFFVALALVLSLPVVIEVHAAGSLIPETRDDPDTAAGKAAIKGEKWQVAVDHFIKVVGRDAKNANAHNYLGFSFRKLKNFESAFRHYGTALQLDPTHKAAHAYIGEAYLETNQLAKAEEHFDALKKLCSFCEERRDLDRAIKAFKQKNNIAS